uniref:Uncharacterized protein n=1 Tax=Triticum urartu TaxID=4572 RepID=A0A8R7QN27_TRIUA
MEESRPGGRFWALDQLGDDDDILNEDTEQHNPYLATITDTFACAKHVKKNGKRRDKNLNKKISSKDEGGGKSATKQ